MHIDDRSAGHGAAICCIRHFSAILKLYVLILKHRACNHGDDRRRGSSAGRDGNSITSGGVHGGMRETARSQNRANGAAVNLRRKFIAI